MVEIILDSFRDFWAVLWAYLPQVVGALVLLLVAWILAKVLRSVVRKALRAAKVDERLAKLRGVEEEGRFPVAQGAGTVTYWLVWLLFIPAVLGALGLEGLLVPVMDMTGKVLVAIPYIVAGILLLVIAYLLGRLLGNLVTSFLTRVSFNTVLVKLGITKKPAEGEWTPSKIAGWTVLVVIMLFAGMMAADLLNFPVLNEAIATVTAVLGRVVLGLVILGIGIFLANLASKALQASGQPQAKTLAFLAQVAIIVFVGAIALHQMGFANEIVTLGFGMLMGAIAVAVAIAFGLGGREVARVQLERWVQSLRSEEPKK